MLENHGISGCVTLTGAVKPGVPPVPYLRLKSRIMSLGTVNAKPTDACQRCLGQISRM